MPLSRNLNTKIVRLMTGFTNADSKNHEDRATLRDFCVTERLALLSRVCKDDVKPGA